MPAHTNNRQYRCTWCYKRYKSSSSLNSHTNNYHAGKPRKARSRSTSKPDGKEPNSNRLIVETQEAQPQNAYEIFDNNILEPLDNVEMEWVPLGVDENMPFVWDESDFNLILPTASINDSFEMNGMDHKIKQAEAAVAANEFCDQMNTNSSSNLSGSNVEDQSKPFKFNIWKKETDDPLACYVDILRAPGKSSNAEHIGNSNQSKGSKKNTALANKFSSFGDTEFLSKNWYSARIWYNRSLCHAEQNTSTFNFSTVYAKRAKCFFKEGLYQACWNDLALAECSGCLSDVLLPQLERHKQSCIAMINKHGIQKSASNYAPMLNYPPDPMFPEMAAVLQIDCSEYSGRHICARQSIAVGEILIIEKGFVAASTAYYEKCCICLTDDPNLKPCRHCTQAMLCKYCENFHHIECGLQMALNLPFPWVTKVLRSFLKAINLFETIDEMMEFVCDAISSWREMQPIAPIVDQKGKYRAFLQLITVPTIQPDLNSHVSKLHAALLRHPNIGVKFQTLKSQRFLTHLLIHHICVINEFTVKVGSVDNGDGCLEIVAPITSYLKHSCAPNVSKFLLGQSIIVVAMRPIEPNEPLFVSYCDILKNRESRQHTLQMEYGLPCSCARCSSPTDIPRDEQFHCDAIEDFVRRNFIYLTSTDQVKRKEITEHIVDVLQRYGCMWNYTITWAYVIFSLLLSQRFQKKLQY